MIPHARFRSGSFVARHGAFATSGDGDSSDGNDNRPHRRDDAMKSSSAIFLPEQSAIAHAASSATAASSTAAGVVSSFVSGIASAASAAAPAVMNALAAANAVVTAVIGIVSGVSAVVAGAIASATATFGPFTVIKVAAELGFGTMESVTAAVGSLTGNPDLQASIAAAISDASAKYAGASQAQLLAMSAEIAAFIESSIDAHLASLAARDHDTGRAREEHAPVVSDTAETVNENAVVSIYLGARDPEGGAITYRIEDDPSGRFRIEDGKLVSGAWDFDTMADKSVVVRVSATDMAGHTRSFDVTVNIADINEPSVVTGVSGVVLLENQAGELVVRLSDQEDGARDVRVPIWPQDHDTSPTIGVPWSYTDAGGLTVTGVEPVTISDVNEAPYTPMASVSFDGSLLTIRLQADDPDGDAVSFVRDGAPISDTLAYTIADLISGVDAFEVASVDPMGLISSAELIEPPNLLASAVADGSVPRAAPTIFGVDTSTVRENQMVDVVVTAYDAVDGVITQTYRIPAQDYEASGTYALTASISNSAGMTASREFSISVSNVNEAPIGRQMDIMVLEGGPRSIIIRADDPDQGIISASVNLPTFDYEGGARTADLTFTITDAGGLSGTVPVHVTVADAIETRTIRVHDLDINGGRGYSGDLTGATTIYSANDDVEIIRIYFSDLGYAPTVSIQGNGGIVNRGSNFVDVQYNGSSGQVEHFNSTITLTETEIDGPIAMDDPHMAFTARVAPGGTGFGPSSQSSTFHADAGDVVSVDWRASPTGDHWVTRIWITGPDGRTDVVSATSGQASGRRVDTVVVPVDGEYTLSAQVGSYDNSKGGVIGADLMVLGITLN